MSTVLAPGLHGGPPRELSDFVESCERFYEACRMSELYDTAAAEVSAIIADFRGHVPAGVTLHEKIYNATLASLKALRRIHSVIHAIPGASPAEQKSAILEAFDRFYREVIEPLDLPGVPDYIERAIVDPAIGSTLHAVAAALVDFVALSQR